MNHEHDASVKQYREYRDYIVANYACLQISQNVPRDAEEKLRRMFQSLGRRKLYKYVSLNSKYAYNNLRDSVFHLSALSSLNDPFEFYSYIDIDLGCQCPECINQMNQGIVDYIKPKLEFIRDHATVYSMCETWKNHALWGTYADSYKGLCVEYDAQQLFDVFGYKLAPIIYQDDVTNRKISELILGRGHDNGEYLDKLNSNQGVREFVRKNYRKELLEFVYEMTMTKHSDWSYEKEWRICNIATDNPNITKNKGINYVKINKLLPTAIILGNRIVDKQSEKIVKLANELSIPAYRLLCIENSYDLEKEIVQL